jgi:RNA polymerase-interacting CarD/CdnL/TRCF family regulator
MTEIVSLYSIGDWVIHYAYGLGQIKKIEKRPIHGELVSCFQVTAQNGAQWWFPRNQTENPRFRLVATQKMLQRALDEFEKAVPELDSDRELWKRRIDDVMAGGDLIATAQILRDLTILRTQRKLNQVEAKAYGLFTNHLLIEWSAITNMNIEVIRPKLNRYLRICKARAMA